MKVTNCNNITLKYCFRINRTYSGENETKVFHFFNKLKAQMKNWKHLYMRVLHILLSFSTFEIADQIYVNF